MSGKPDTEGTVSEVAPGEQTPPPAADFQPGDGIGKYIVRELLGE